MDVDEAGRNRQAACVDFFSAARSQARADGGDPAAADRDVACDGRLAQAVEDGAVADDEVGPLALTPEPTRIGQREQRRRAGAEKGSTSDRHHHVPRVIAESSHSFNTTMGSIAAALRAGSSMASSAVQPSTAAGMIRVCAASDGSPAISVLVT